MCTKLVASAGPNERVLTVLPGEDLSTVSTSTQPVLALENNDGDDIRTPITREDLTSDFVLTLFPLVHDHIWSCLPFFGPIKCNMNKIQLLVVKIQI